MAALTVALLGEPCLRTAEGIVACRSKKAFGLFCFLAHTRARHSRRDLAALFWGGNVDAARASLRTTLLRFPESLSSRLEVTRDSIALCAPLDVDSARFIALAARADLPALEEAAALYGGDLLAGLEIDASAEFDDWLVRERSRLKLLATSVFDRLIEGHRERARQDAAHAEAARAAALAAARRWCELDPASESAHRWLIRLYLDAGRSDAALAQLESCRREMATASGRVPSAQTLALVEPLLDAGARRPTAGGAAQDAREPRPHEAFVAGIPGTAFFGRVDELAELEQLLGEPACRLLTLQAMGGMGKSRLAAVVVEHVAGRFRQGASWIALDEVERAAQLPLAIAAGLGIDVAARGDVVAALREALRAQERLLVLDNFEHLLHRDEADADPVDVLLSLLSAAPEIKLLVTSREVLGVQEEWIYELRGLPCPDVDGALGSVASTPSSAVELFAHRARQAYAGFSLAAEWPHVARLTRLVEGMPLALELAAAWARTMPCGDLVATIEAEAGRVGSRHRNRPARQRSADAVVRTSYGLLDREQQKALPALSLFAGGFTHEAATQVCAAPLRVLSALIDKSLVQRRADGRLGLHELVRQFARNRLAESGESERVAERRHTAYYTALLLRLRAALDRSEGLLAHTQLTTEMPNLLAAAARWELPAQADEVAEPWLTVLLGRGLQRLAKPFADRVLVEGAALHPLPRAQVLTQRAIANTGLGQREEALSDLEQALALARSHGFVGAEAQALLNLAMVGALRDDAGAMRARLDELEPLLAPIDDPALIARARFYGAMQLETEGRYDDALEAYGRTLRDAQEAGVSPVICATLRNLRARMLLHAGRAADAENLLREAIPVHEQAGNQPRLAQALLIQAESLLLEGDAASGRRAALLAERVLKIHEASGHPPGISSARHVLGRALHVAGDAASARRCYERAADVASPVLHAEALASLGHLLLETGERDAARRIACACVTAAAEHDLATVRWCATLLAVAVLRDEQPVACAGWLRALVAGDALDVVSRRRADALAAGLPSGATGTATLDAAAMLAAMRTALEAARAD